MADNVQENSAGSSMVRGAALVRDAIRSFPTTINVSHALAMRELLASFRQSKLGFLWILLQPALYGAIFVVVKYGMAGAGFVIDTGHVPAALFALTGMMLYQAWMDALTRQLDALRTSKSVLRTLKMPPEVLFFTPLFIALFTFMGRLVVIVVAMAALRWVPPLSALWFPVAAFGVVLMGQAIGFALLPIASLYRDIGQFVSSITIGILLISPVLYPATTQTDSILHVINLINPLASTLTTARDALLGGDFVLLQPALIWYGIALVVTLFMLVLMRAVLPILVERAQ